MHYSSFLSCFSILTIIVAGPIISFPEQKSTKAISARGDPADYEGTRQEQMPGPIQGSGHARSDRAHTRHQFPSGDGVWGGNFKVKTPESEALWEKLKDVFNKKLPENGAQSSEGSDETVNGDQTVENGNGNGASISSRSEFREAPEAAQKTFIWGIALTVGGRALGPVLGDWIMANWAILLPELLLL